MWRKKIKFIWNTWKKWWNKTGNEIWPVCLHNFSEPWNVFLRVSMENCFWCYFRQLIISSAFRKCKKDCNILKTILVQGFCSLKTEISRSLIGSRLEVHVFKGLTMIFTRLFFSFWKTCRLQLISVRVHLFILLNAIRVNACPTLWFPWIAKDLTRVKGKLIQSAKALYAVDVCVWNKKECTTKCRPHQFLF